MVVVRFIRPEGAASRLSGYRIGWRDGFKRSTTSMLMRSYPSGAAGTPSTLIVPRHARAARVPLALTTSFWSNPARPTEPPFQVLRISRICKMSEGSLNVKLVANELQLRNVARTAGQQSRAHERRTKECLIGAGALFLRRLRGLRRLG
jgi:hypothetical protein